MAEREWSSGIYERAVEKAITFLLQRQGEWSSILEAYWLLRRHEDEIGFPFTYNMVEEIVEQVRRLHGRGEAAALEAHA